jgi:hypothetical protein
MFQAVCHLPPSEAKLLLFIFWQTRGQSGPREISLTQFERGLDGTPGVGLGRDTVALGLKKLEARGLIHVEPSTGPQRGRFPTLCYSIGDLLLERKQTA